MSVERPPGDQFSGQGDAGARIQILATEHWSLLATRSLTYTESFSRVSMFFSVLSGAVISLALIAQAGRFGQVFLIAAILLLSTVLFVGFAWIHIQSPDSEERVEAHYLVKWRLNSHQFLPSL